MEFFELLKQIRRDTGMSLKELSTQSGIPYQSLRNYSSRIRTPDTENLQKLAAVPALAPYRSLLIGDKAAIDEEINALLYSLLKQGRRDEVLAILREVESETAATGEPKGNPFGSDS